VEYASAAAKFWSKFPVIGLFTGDAGNDKLKVVEREE
jgi:hypothetical protein